MIDALNLSVAPTDIEQEEELQRLPVDSAFKRPVDLSLLNLNADHRIRVPIPDAVDVQPD